MLTMTVAELIETLQRMPQDLPVEINNHHTCNLSYVNAVTLFDSSNSGFAVDQDDYPMVVIHTETWASMPD